MPAVRGSAIALPLAGILLFALQAEAATKIWTGAGGNFSWHTANNWSPVGIPGADDDVVIDLGGGQAITVVYSTGTTTINSLSCSEALSLVGGTLQVQADSEVSGLLSLGSGGGGLGGVLAGTGSVTVTGMLSFVGGVGSGMGGTGQTVIAPSGSLLITGSQPKSLTGGRKLINHGTGTWEGTALFTIGGFGTQFVNAPTGVLTAFGGTGVGNGGGDAVFINEGLWRLLGGGAFGVNQSWVNEASGVVEIEAGVLRFFSSGTNRGVIALSAEGAVDFVSNVATLEQSSQVVGDGVILTSAVVNVAEGSVVSVASTAVSGGTLTVDGAFATQALSVSGGSATFNASVGFGGAVSLTGGTATFNGDQTFSSLSLTNGTLGGSGTVTVTGSLTWSPTTVNSTMSGVGQTVVAPGGTLSISGGVQKSLIGGRVLVNHGTGTWTGAGAINLGGTGTQLVNGPGGEFEVQTSASIGAASSDGVIVNAGLWRYAAPGTQQVSKPFENLSSGGVPIEVGTMGFSSLTNLGTVTVSSAAALQLTGSGSYGASSHLSGAGSVTISAGTHAFPAGTFGISGPLAVSGGTVTVNDAFEPTGLVVSGGSATFNASVGFGGAVSLTGGTATFNGDQTFSSLSLTNGTLGGSGTVTVTGSLTWSPTTVNSTMSGVGQTVVAPGGTLSISGGVQKSLIGGRVLVNHGTGTWTGAGAINLGGTGTQLVNGPGGEFEVQTSASIGAASSDGVIVNAGLWRYAAPGTQQVSKPFTNQGGLEVVAGSLSVAGGVTNLAGSTLTGGTWTVESGGVLQFPAGSVVETLGPGASVSLVGPGSFPAANALSTVGAGASLALSGGRVFSAAPGAQPFSNAGSIELGPDSELSIVGGYAQLPTGALKATVSSAARRPRVVSSGSAALDGALVLAFGRDFTPTLGDTSTLLVASGGVSGSFAAATHPLVPSCVVEVGYGPTSVFFGLETTPPIAVCKSITITLDSTGRVELSPSDLGAESSDNCGIASMTLSKSAFTCADLGANEITLVVTDFAGNSATCDATVTIEPTSAFLGSAGTSWFEEGNWCDGLPSSKSNVVVGLPMLVDGMGAMARSLEVVDGGEVVIGSWDGASLTISEHIVVRAGGAVHIVGNGRLEAASIVIQSGGTLSLLDASATLVVHDLTVEQGGAIGWVAGTIELTGTWTQVEQLLVGCAAAPCTLLLAGGTVDAPLVMVCADGALTGSGMLAGALDNGGVVMPGADLGSLVVAGSYGQGGDAELWFDIGGLVPRREFDRLVVGGSAFLGGVVRVGLVEGFVPLCGDDFSLIAARALGGEFATVDTSAVDAAIPEGLVVRAGVVGVAFTVTIASAADLDGDGFVGPSDLAVLLGAWGRSAGPADLNGDGAVDAADLAVLLGSWGPC